MGCSFYEWHSVAETLGNSYRVILFHRPGLGLSEIRSDTRNTQKVVSEINDMMCQLDLNEPIILVGHSYGGLCAQHFAKVYPEAVAGMVLVDSTSVDLKKLDDLNLPVLNKGETDIDWIEKCHSYSLMKPVELRELLNPSLTDKQRQLPYDMQQRLIEFQTSPFLYRAMASEIWNWKTDAEIIKYLGKFPDIPLIVIGRDKEYTIKLGTKDGLPEWELRLLEETWQELIVNQANLSKNSELTFAKDSSHSIYNDRPDIVIRSIRKIARKNSN